jgi:hypothetical protein
MLLTHADLLKEHLDADADITGVSVHVDRKLNLREVASAELSKKTAGAFLGISLAGWTPENPDSGEGFYWGELRYEFSFATVPHILEELELPTFDELLRRIVLSIHGWKPGGLEAAYCSAQRWRVGAGSYVPDDSFLTYLFPATIAENFSDPVPASDT